VPEDEEMDEHNAISDVAKRLADRSLEVWSVHDRALVMLDAGEDVILLSVGDLDLATDSSTIRQALDSLKAGRTHYSPPAGEPDLRETIARIER